MLAALVWGCGAEEKSMKAERAAMVQAIKAKGFDDERILAAMERVQRHQYIPESYRGLDAYGDHPCSIGHGQTISQPFIVAYMTRHIAPKAGMKILEIGTGSGYQAAVLAELGAEVYSVEIVPPLAEHAREVLAAEGYTKVQVRTGDGYQGWSEHAPFDAIIVTCAPAEIPEALKKQLKVGGRMILPVGVLRQQLVILEKTAEGFREIPDLDVRFVPMVKGSD